MRLSSVVLSLALLGSVSFAQAQQTAPAPAASSTPAASMSGGKTMSAEDKKAKAKECSDQADAKGLHGKARKKFRSECKRGA